MKKKKERDCVSSEREKKEREHICVEKESDKMFREKGRD